MNPSIGYRFKSFDRVIQLCKKVYFKHTSYIVCNKVYTILIDLAFRNWKFESKEKILQNKQTKLPITDSLGWTKLDEWGFQTGEQRRAPSLATNDDADAAWARRRRYASQDSGGWTG